MCMIQVYVLIPGITLHQPHSPQRAAVSLQTVALLFSSNVTYLKHKLYCGTKRTYSKLNSSMWNVVHLLSIPTLTVTTLPTLHMHLTFTCMLEVC